MSDHNWQFGDWGSCPDLCGEVIRCIHGAGCSSMFVRKNGHCGNYNAEYLADCDSFDWQPPKPIEPPKGYRRLEECETVQDIDKVFYDNRWNSTSGSVGMSVKDAMAEWSSWGLQFARKIEPKVRPMTRAEFLAAWKKRGFCPLIDHEDDIDVVLGVIDEPTEFDPEIVNTEKHGWLALDVLANFKFASDETYLTVEG